MPICHHSNFRSSWKSRTFWKSFRSSQSSRRMRHCQSLFNFHLACCQLKTPSTWEKKDDHLVFLFFKLSKVKAHLFLVKNKTPCHPSTCSTTWHVCSSRLFHHLCRLFNRQMLNLWIASSNKMKKSSRRQTNLSSHYLKNNQKKK